jgi:hypothetical protein
MQTLMCILAWPAFDPGFESSPDRDVAGTGMVHAIAANQDSMAFVYRVMRRMRRLVTVLALTVIALGVMVATARGGDAVWHFDGDHQAGEFVSTTSQRHQVDEPGSSPDTIVDPDDTVAADSDMAGLDATWLTTAAVVAVLLVVRMVRLESERG